MHIINVVFIIKRSLIPSLVGVQISVCKTLADPGDDDMGKIEKLRTGLIFDSFLKIGFSLHTY